MIRTPTFTPLFHGDWKNVLMIHFAVNPDVLQEMVPFELDTIDGKAFITLVAFRQENLKFANLGPCANVLTWPMKNHAFLNVRTYVKDGDERGIHFITEFVDNLPARVTGPLLYGLPYQLAKINYKVDFNTNTFTGNVRGKKGQFRFTAQFDTSASDVAKPGSTEHFLHERYNAYNTRGHTILKFQVAHETWRMHPTKINFQGTGNAFDWLAESEFIGAYFTGGFDKVGLGKPVNIRRNS